MSETPTTTTATTPVNWGAVILGCFLAVFSGLFIGLASVLAGNAAQESGAPRPIGFVVGLLGPIVVYGAVYLLARRHFRDFCRGLIVGACFVILITGACSAIFLAS
jgi:hypothetical protein